MKTIFISLSKCIALLVLLMVGMGKVIGQECNLDNKAKTVGVIPYSDDFITQEEVMERNYAITSFRMIDTATVAVLTGASDMILVYSFTDNQILYKIQLPISARAFDYDNGLFHAIGDRTYLSIDSYGMIHEKKDFQEPKLLNEEIFIITDLKVIDGQPIVHESNSNTYSITSDGLQEIDTFYYHYTRGCKIHPQYIDENSFILYNETPSKSGSLNVSMGSLGLEGKLSCIEYISVDDDYTAINIETSHNRTGCFVKSYLLVVNSNGEVINLVEVPINFISYIQRPFIYKDNAWYYAFSGQEGITIFKIGTNTNRIDSPDSIILSDDNFDDSLLETNNGISYEDTTINNPTRGNWRTITQAWYNAHEYCAKEWTPIPDNVTTTCTWISGSGAGYIITPITSYYYTEIGVPYKWYGFTDHVSFEELASEGKYTGSRITTSSCGGSAYLNVSDTYVIGVDCSGFVSRCLELSSHTGTGQIASSSDFTNYGSVVGASSSVFQKGDALNKTGDPGHVRLYTGHTSDGQITVFESSGSPDWKTHSATYRTSDFSGYNIMRYNNMRNIILRLNGNIELIQNGSVVSNVTQGQPLTVNYSVTNAGSETWSGYVSLWIERSDGKFMCIQENEFTPIYAGGTESFTFSNNGVSSPDGTTKFYVRVRNYNAGDYNRAYDVGSLTNSNPLEFQIVGGSSGGGNCDYDELWTLHKVDVGEWSYKTSSISSGGCRVYRVVLLSSNTFTFQTCYPGDANFDTKLSLYDSNCNFIMEDDDGCTGNLSSLEFTNTGGNAFYYLKIEGFGSNSGSFTIAAKREEPSTSYVINASAIPSSGGTVGGAGTYQSGSTCNLTASPNAGYFFSYWSKNNSQVSTNASYSFTVTESASYEAHFGLNNYTITATASPSAGGTVNGGGTYSYGSNCTLTASPATGYSFVRWTRNGSQVSTNPSYSFTVTSNASYVAEFSQNSYTISVSSIPSSGGTVSGGGTYNYGSNCNLTASPNAGYFFSYWSKNNSQVSTNASYSFTVTESASYEAHFGLNNYTITATASPSAGGTVSGGGTYSHGSLCTLTATPSASYTFVNWTENESEVSTDATYSFTVTGNRTLVANFAIAQTEFHWTPNDSQYANTMTAIAIIQIDGVEQRTTALELGAFCGNECRGRQLLVYYPQVDRYLLFLDIYGNDGDALSFRLYDHGTGQESNLTCSTSETFVSNATLGSVASPYVFSFTNAITQTTTMPLGWSWWSPAVEVEGEDGLAQLEESIGDNGIMIKSRLNGFVSNYGGMWMGSLTSISSEQTYLIQTAAACEMSLTGSAPLPTSHAISLAPGWNWIGYPLGESMSVSTALSGITPTENDMLKSRDYGFTIYYPGFGWMGSLNTVEPGMGLMYESHNNQTITLTYPGTVKSESLKQNLMARGDHWMPVTHPYPNNMTVLAVVELDDVELQSDHYELGVFVGDECRGSAKLVYEAAMNRYVAYLAIYGEEPMPLHFGLYDTESGEEHFDAVELVFGPNATYGIPTAPYVVRFRSTTGVEEQGIRASVFPNPVDRGQTLWIGLEASEGNPIRMEIVNELGAIVSTETVYKTPATIQAPNTAGVYLLRITVEGEGSCYRKLVVRR